MTESTDTPSPPPAIECRNLTKVYRTARGDGERIVAVEGLDLTIRAGEVYGLIGPNGAGKTTLLRMVATLLPPTRGRILVTGLDTERQREQVCGRLGFVPDRFHLYDDLKVWEYLEFFAIAYGCPRDQREKIIDSIIELTDLGVRRDNYCDVLSKGMRQRLLLAKTLVHDPDVLVMDEPTDGMDPQARIEFRNIIRTLAKMGKTVMISSHILADLSFFCTSIGIMESGRLLVGGTVDEVRRSLDLNPSVLVHYLDPRSDARGLVKSLPGVSRVRAPRPGEIRFDFEGNDEQRAAVLDALVRGGVQVLEFTYQESTLEEILLSVGASKVQ